MIAWLNVPALVGLTLVAGPVLVHLLRRRRSRRVPFPSLRFLEPSHAAAVRVHWPSDWLLLIIRMAIVTLAVCALAQPLVLSTPRLARWNARVARSVIVVDSRPVAAEAAMAELQTSAFPHRIALADVRQALPRAVAHLQAAPPARREVVIVGELRRGMLDARDLAGVPDAIGVRFLPFERPAAAATVPAMTMFAYADVPARRQMLTLHGESTGVALEAAAGTEGLRVVAGTDAERDVAPLLRAVARAGAPAPSPEQSIVVFLDAPLPAVQRIPPGWMLDTIARLMNDVELQRLSSDVEIVGRRPERKEPNADEWLVVLRDTARRPLLRAAALRAPDGRAELLLEAPVPPRSFIAAAIVRAALVARYGPVAQPEREVAPVPSAQLRRWTRAAAPVSAAEARRVGSSDGRWVWLGVLLLLVLEAAIRRPRATRAPEVEVHAA